ncbi:purine-cytosine permease-like protein [Actinocorallia herbida]|uniref:Purine-cytosine permease-like protein n=1 Tax=Actinocorallia herbida TaxID=58109 RepID=A0A3N1CXU8_9ACTN|nr:cytosine permease [Actinocorallia herbida]ROO86066.1 purine-cytosine permease-like protein [Actinocorallia herbida]
MSGNPPTSGIERRGIDTVPAAERSYSPRSIFAVLYGSDLTFGVIVVGALPIAFGLGWWAAFWAILAGGALGGLVLAPMGLFGPRTGTNNAVSSGAHFGVGGRFIGTMLSLFSAFGFVAVTLWTSGDALVSTLGRIFGFEAGAPARAVGYALIAMLVLLVSIWGIHALLKVQSRIMVPIMTVVMLAGVIAFAPDFTAGTTSDEPLLGGFWPTWTLSALVVASTVISYGPFIGDWARYIDPDEHSTASVVAATGFGGFAGIALPSLWGAFIASSLPASATGVFVPDLVAASPAWYLPGIILLGLVAGCAQAAVGLYGTGLDTSSLIPRLSRVTATAAIAVVAVAFVYLGAFVWDAAAAVSAFLILLVIVTTPWIVILTIGYVVRRGHYHPDDLQVFTRGQRGGRYWFTAGFNWRAVAAWLPASVIGVLFGAAPPVFTGPWANAAGGVDLSFLSAGLTAAVLYTVFLVVAPEPAYVHGPRGPRFGSANAAEEPRPLADAVAR